MNWARRAWLLLVYMSILALALGVSCGDDDDDDNDDSLDDDDDDDDDSADDDDDAISDDDDDNNDDTSPEPDWRFIHDDQGRAMIFHGCNFDGAAKGPSGLPPQTRDDALFLSEQWGFNFSRYLIFWARIEPQPGIYDEQYLDEVEVRLDWMAEAGLQTVLDMHQDVWGPFIEGSSGSDGAPEWATITDGWPHVDFASLLGNWAFNYLSPDVLRAFDNFWDYDRHPELQDHYAAMWAHVVARFKDHPAILGYDPMNEPWQGTGFLRYRDFDENEYTAFNQRMIDAIRAVDTEGWIFYEPCALPANQALRSYMGPLTDPRPGRQRLAYFPHLYPVLLDLGGGYIPEVDHALERWEEFRVLESENQSAPLLSGEWSMLQWFDAENRMLWLNEAMAMLDRVSAGWAYWDCGWLLRDTHQEYVDRVASIYPRAIAGDPISYSLSMDSSYPESVFFVLSFRERKGVTGPTEIYLPEDRNFPGGWDLLVTDPPGTWSSDYNEDSQVLSVWTNPDLESHTITIMSR
jgi:endoglycosylceramidase